MLDLPHIAIGIVYLFFGTIGGIYALRTLNMLRSSPELRVQRGIWLPILMGTIFFAVAGFLHIAEHTFYEGYEIELLHEVFVVTGVSSFVVGVFQYSKMQISYVHLKTKVLEEAQVETAKT